MSSGILTKIGLGNLDIGILIIVLTVLVIALIVIVVMQMQQTKYLKERYKKFMQGNRPRSLETQIQELIGTVDDLQKTSDKNQEDFQRILLQQESTFQKMGLVKYDAYKEMGGKLSYCLSILDENNNGFIINSVHSSTGCYSYAKRIREGKCNIEMSPEEKEAVNRAMLENSKNVEKQNSEEQNTEE